MEKLLARLFCHTKDCCPQILLDEAAESEQQVVIRDDFGGIVRMSREQLADFRDRAKGGAFDSVQP